MLSPDEINARAMEYARKYQNPGLSATLKLVADGKIVDKAGNVMKYGEITHLNGNRAPDIIFSFADGVIKHASPLIWINEDNVVKGSVKFDS